jgi:hypothetical protein
MPKKDRKETDLRHDNSPQTAHYTSDQSFRPKDELPSAVVNSHEVVKIQLCMNFRAREENLGCSSIRKVYCGMQY